MPAMQNDSTGKKGSSPRSLPTIVSAPGKVLITGGYLVLDNKYSGLVLTTTSRFYTHLVRDTSPEECFAAVEKKKGDEKIKEKDTKFLISLCSPQFHRKRTYEVALHRGCNPGDSFYMLAETDEKTERNPYVENTLLFCLSYISHRLGNTPHPHPYGLSITIVADNDFYSQSRFIKERTISELEKLPKFFVPPVGEKLNKTGLGSSAALITSLVGALFTHFGIVKDINHDDNNYRDKEIIHRMAQFCHCVAQDKIGSGFDVCAATFGSQRYSRFDPLIIQSPLQKATQSKTKCTLELLNEVIQCLNVPSGNSNQIMSSHDKWIYERVKFGLPSGFYLLVADVDQGTNTPSMVGNVMKWRKEKSNEANIIWEKLKEMNDSIEQGFQVLHQFANQDNGTYMNELKWLSQQDPEFIWSDQCIPSSTLGAQILKCLQGLRKNYIHIRLLMKEMGKKVSQHVEKPVPIEPDEQSILLDATMNTKGCLFAGVPGAGGFDAIFCIVFSGGSSNDYKIIQNRLEELWTNHKANVCPLLLTESNKGVRMESDIVIPSF